MKKLIIFVLVLSSLTANVLKPSKVEKLEEEKNKSSLEADLTKDLWINPLSIDAEHSKSKSGNSTSTTKKAYLNFSQDIFKSGGIYYTIQKAKEEKKLSVENYENSFDTENTEALKLVLNIKKIDLQIQKQAYLIKNKKIEIEKKEAQYLNGTVNIEELDTAVIENNELENQIEDLEVSKYDLLKAFKGYANVSYKQINPVELSLVSLETFLENNKELVIQKLNSSISKYEQKITSSNYLPKVSIYSQVGYEDNSAVNDQDDFYNHGVKLSIPLDYNMNKNKEISKLNYRLSKINERLKKEEKINQYEASLKSLEHINKKINNSISTIKKYEDIYGLTKDLVDGLLKTEEDLKTIENRLNSSKLDIDILKIDKQILIYEINKHI